MQGDDALDFLDSKSLIGFQLDASHLHNVLHTIIRNQQAAAQSHAVVVKRLQGVESVVQDVQERLAVLDSAVARVSGSGEDVRAFKSHLQDVAAVVDNLSRQVVPELRRSQDDLRRAMNPVERAVQQLTQAVSPLEQNQVQLQQIVEDSTKDMQQLQRGVNVQLTALQQNIEELNRDQQTEGARVGEVLRELQIRADRIERTVGPNAGQMKDFLEELNLRTNENFRQVEVSAKAVDSELHRIRTDLANVRTELNVVDNNGRQKVAKITEDMDSKFEMVLGLLQSFEKNSTELEEHLAAAGRALANSRQQQHAAFSAGPRSTTTTTTSALRGGAMLSDVRRSVTGDLSDPRRGISGNW